MSSNVGYAFGAFALLFLMWLSTLKPKRGAARVSVMELFINWALRWARWWWCFALALKAGYLKFQESRDQVQIDGIEATHVEEWERV